MLLLVELFALPPPPPPPDDVTLLFLRVNRSSSAAASERTAALSEKKMIKNQYPKRCIVGVGRREKGKTWSRSSKLICF